MAEQPQYDKARIDRVTRLLKEHPLLDDSKFCTEADLKVFVQKVILVAQPDPEVLQTDEPNVFRIESAEGPAMVVRADSTATAILPQTAVKLLDLCGPYGAVLRKKKEQVRAIGQEIYDLYGQPGMQIVFYFIQACWASGRIPLIGTENDFHPRELEMAWDGIGLWRG